MNKVWMFACLAPLLASNAFAAFDLDTVTSCTGYKKPPGITGDDLALDNMTVNDVSAVECWGLISNNDDTNEDKTIAALAGFNGTYDFFQKDNGGGGSVPADTAVDIDLSYTINAGTWSFNADKLNAATVSGDFLVALKQGNSHAYWLFDGAFNNPINGTYFVSWRGNGTDLSHMSVYGRTTGSGNPPSGAPEPTSIALLSLGAIGMAAAHGRRRRRR